jgi:hypothetical protein
MKCHGCGNDDVLLIETFSAEIMKATSTKTNKVLGEKIVGREFKEKYYQCNKCAKWFELDDKGRMVFHKK